MVYKSSTQLSCSKLLFAMKTLWIYIFSNNMKSTMVSVLPYWCREWVFVSLSVDKDDGWSNHDSAADDTDEERWVSTVGSGARSGKPVAPALTSSVLWCQINRISTSLFIRYWEGKQVFRTDYRQRIYSNWYTIPVYTEMLGRRDIFFLCASLALLCTGT